MIGTVTARWQSWFGQSTEHLVLREGPGEIVAEAVVLGGDGDDIFAACYRIECDKRWCVRKVEFRQIGRDHEIELSSDGAGNWRDGSGIPLPALNGAIDIDISITPFTNTLPIRRLNLQSGQSAEVLAVYILLPDPVITTDLQRYTCLQAGIRYRYQSVDSDFTRDIEVDGHGLVLTYPGLFRRKS
jgi:hypothetical protein